MGDMKKEYTSGRAFHWSGLTSISENEDVAQGFAKTSGFRQRGLRPSTRLPGRKEPELVRPFTTTCAMVWQVVLFSTTCFSTTPHRLYSVQWVLLRLFFS